MITLALDLGGTTGWALGDRTGRFSSGSTEWMPKKLVKAQTVSGMDRRCDGRVIAFSRWLGQQISEKTIERIVFEDVQFAGSTMQAHLWASYRGAVWVQAMVDRGRTVEMHCVPVGTLKKFFTGYGGAEKVHMAQALLTGPHFPDEFKVGVNRKGQNDLLETSSGRSVDDNEVDALALLAYSRAVDNGSLKWPYDQ